MKKDRYELSEIEIIEFVTEDILSISGLEEDELEPDTPKP